MYFVTGTDTNVGKSFISALLTYKLKATYFKPIQAGDLETGGDTAFVQSITKLPEKHFLKPCFSLAHALSPHEAAKRENIHIESNVIYHRLSECSSDNMIIEGAGGIYVPINDNEFVLDLIKTINIPIIIVVRSTLGTINHTLLTLRSLEHFNIPIKGIIMNGTVSAHNKQAIEFYGGYPVIAEIPFCDNMTEFNIDDYAAKIDLS